MDPERAIVFAIPVFFLMMGVEIVVNRVRFGTSRYRFADSITNLSCGVGQQVLGVFLGLIGIAGYEFVWQKARLATLSVSSVAGWIVLLFAVDLGYYVFHLASHRVNFLWAEHVVHHQSEEYNLSVALRQSWLDQAIEWIFFLPLAVAGFPTAMFVGMLVINTLYQFWIHTRAVGPLGPVEWIFNTPSAHRVHHGINPKYLDKNYAGVFLIWDRLFGTYTPETEEPVYGTVKPLASFNPLWANVQYWVQMFGMARATKRFSDKLRVFVAPPEWRPADLGGIAAIPEVSREAQKKYGVPYTRGRITWIAANYVALLGGTTGFLWFERSMNTPEKALSVGLIVGTVVACGGLFEVKRWAIPLEVARFGGLGALVFMFAR